MPYADVTKRRTYHAGYMQQWRARKAQQTPPAILGAPQLEVSALLDTIQHLDTNVRELHQQTVQVRSLHDPQLLENVELIAHALVALVEVTGVLVERLTAPAIQPPQPPAPWLRSALAGEGGQLHATVLQLASHPARVLEVLKAITGVLVGLSTVSPPPVHPLQPHDLAALPRPQWHQEARAVVEQLDTVFDTWSIPGPAQNVLRQLAALLVQMTDVA